jgi:hypothetical protein
VTQVGDELGDPLLSFGAHERLQVLLNPFQSGLNTGRPEAIGRIGFDSSGRYRRLITRRWRGRLLSEQTTGENGGKTNNEEAAAHHDRNFHLAK